MKRFNRGMVLGVTLLGCFGLQAQPASDEQIKKALEVLRQTQVESTAPQAPQASPAQPAMEDRSSQKVGDGSSAEATRQLTPDQEKKALEVLRSIEVARPIPAASSSSQKPSEAAIQEAYDQAKQASKDRKAGATPVSQDTLDDEMALVESEIMKAKQDSGQPLNISSSERPAEAKTPSADSPARPATQSIQPMTAEQEAKALDLLRTVSQEIMNEPVPAMAEKAAPVQKEQASVESPSAKPETAAPKILSRDQQLADLLNAYRNEEISAAQYHKERARILAKP